MEAQGSNGCSGFFGIDGQMIEFTDMTLCESHGYYKETKKLMEEDGPISEWMLHSSAFVTAPMSAFSYILHFWKDGRVVIHETDRPMRVDSLDEDLRELSQWCRDAGWKELSVSDRLLITDRQAYEFWRRAFIAGLIVSEKLQQHEEEEMKRLSQAYLIEKEREEDENGT